MALRFTHSRATTLGPSNYRYLTVSSPTAGLVVLLADAKYRAFTDTFSGIRPVDAPMFIIGQIAGAFAATWLFQWLTQALPAVADRVVVPHGRDATEPAGDVP
jgi:hypothetical protein